MQRKYNAKHEADDVTLSTNIKGTSDKSYQQIQSLETLMERHTRTQNLIKMLERKEKGNVPVEMPSDHDESGSSDSYIEAMAAEIDNIDEMLSNNGKMLQTPKSDDHVHESHEVEREDESKTKRHVSKDLQYEVQKKKTTAKKIVDKLAKLQLEYIYIHPEQKGSLGIAHLTSLENDVSAKRKTEILKKATSFELDKERGTIAPRILQEIIEKGLTGSFGLDSKEGDDSDTLSMKTFDIRILASDVDDDFLGRVKEAVFSLLGGLEHVAAVALQRLIGLKCSRNSLCHGLLMAKDILYSVLADAGHVKDPTTLLELLSPTTMSHIKLLANFLQVDNVFHCVYERFLRLNQVTLLLKDLKFTISEVQHEDDIR